MSSFTNYAVYGILNRGVVSPRLGRFRELQVDWRHSTRSEDLNESSSTCVSSWEDGDDGSSDGLQGDDGQPEESRDEGEADEIDEVLRIYYSSDSEEGDVYTCNLITSEDEETSDDEQGSDGDNNECTCGLKTSEEEETSGDAQDSDSDLTESCISETGYHGSCESNSQEGENASDDESVLSEFWGSVSSTAWSNVATPRSPTPPEPIRLPSLTEWAHPFRYEHPSREPEMVLPRPVGDHREPLPSLRSLPYIQCFVEGGCPHTPPCL